MAGFGDVSAAGAGAVRRPAWPAGGTTGIVRRGVYGSVACRASVTCYGCPSCLGARSPPSPGRELASVLYYASRVAVRSNRLVWQHLCSECGLRFLPSHQLRSSIAGAAGSQTSCGCTLDAPLVALPVATSLLASQRYPRLMSASTCGTRRDASRRGTAVRRERIARAHCAPALGVP